MVQVNFVASARPQEKEMFNTEAAKGQKEEKPADKADFKKELQKTREQKTGRSERRDKADKIRVKDGSAKDINSTNDQENIPSTVSLLPNPDDTSPLLQKTAQLIAVLTDEPLQFAEKPVDNPAAERAVPEMVKIKTTTIIPAVSGEQVPAEETAELKPQEPEESNPLSTAADNPEAEDAAPSTGNRVKSKIMFLSNQKREMLKVQVKISPVGVINKGEAPEETGQVKKLMLFESHRLSAEKLPDNSAAAAGQESPPQGDEDYDGSNPNLIRTVPESGKTSPKEFQIRHGQVMPKAEQVYEQIVDKARLMVKTNSSEMKLDLKPEFMGKMTIKVLVEDGVVTARFITDNHQVKQLLENNLTALRQTLEMHGLKVEKTEVNVQINNNSMYGSSADSGQENRASPQYRQDYQPDETLNYEAGYSPGEEGIEDAWLIHDYYGIEQGSQMSLVV